MRKIACAQCGEFHDISNIERTQRRPDALLDIPEEERGKATFESKDVCVLYGRRSDPSGAEGAALSSADRYFFRVLLPFRVEGRERPFSWGVWVEVSEPTFDRIKELWSDPDQHLEPPLPATLANQIGDFPAMEGLPGFLHLQAPPSVAKFFLSEGDHPLIRHQREGLTEAIVLEWLEPYLHKHDD